MSLRKNKPPEGPPRDLRTLTAPLAVPAVQVVKQEEPALSHFGGEPGLPAGVAWPEHGGKRLDFLARLSLAQLQGAGPIEWLPHEGALLFFYDLEEEPWGYDPSDRGKWAVMRVPDVAVAPGPPGLETPIAFAPVGFRAIRTFPSDERAPEALKAFGFSEAEWDSYADDIRTGAYGGQPAHQVGGLPSNVQGDSMELESQLASNGLYCGDETGYNDPRARTLGPGAADWRLLFQLDTDDDLGVMWGDCGMLYFWVREQDARRGDFSGTWVVLQCA